MKSFNVFTEEESKKKQYKVRIEHPNQKQIYSITAHAKDENEAKEIAHNTVNQHLMPRMAPFKKTKVHSVEEV